MAIASPTYEADVILEELEKVELGFFDDEKATD